MDSKKEALIKALVEEDLRISQSRSQDVTYAIAYLQTGKSPVGLSPDPDDYPILDAVINDLETMYQDYAV